MELNKIGDLVGFIVISCWAILRKFVRHVRIEKL